MKSTPSKHLAIAGLDVTPIRNRDNGDCELQILVENETTYRSRKTSLRVSKRDLVGLAFQILFELRETSEFGRDATFYAGRMHADLLTKEIDARRVLKAPEELTS